MALIEIQSGTAVVVDANVFVYHFMGRSDVLSIARLGIEILTHMRQAGLSILASTDAAFDRIPEITRFAPADCS